MANVGTNEPGSITPGSPEARRQVAAHERLIREQEMRAARRAVAEEQARLREADRPIRAMELSAESQRRIAVALERIADALTGNSPEGGTPLSGPG
jgi:hypothetical protein